MNTRILVLRKECNDSYPNEWTKNYDYSLRFPKKGWTPKMIKMRGLGPFFKILREIPGIYDNYTSNTHFCV